ncbi:MAG: hypothetical protein GC159_17475 [Phycisphaera sp.]|nr:hypothetical protein [Phycisphaera sp.]
MTTQLPTPTRPYASNDAERAAGMPVYTPDDEPLVTRNPRMAWLDVMILAYAMRLHADRASRTSPCDPDVARIINDHLAATKQALSGGHPLGDVRPCGDGGTRGEGYPTGAQDATRANVGKTRENRQIWENP